MEARIIVLSFCCLLLIFINVMLLIKLKQMDSAFKRAASDANFYRKVFRFLDRKGLDVNKAFDAVESEEDISFPQEK